MKTAMWRGSLRWWSWTCGSMRICWTLNRPRVRRTLRHSFRTANGKPSNSVSNSARPHLWKRGEDKRKELPMLYYALVFLVVGLIAGALGLAGVAAVASQISWILFLVGIVLLVLHLVTG